MKNAFKSGKKEDLDEAFGGFSNLDTAMKWAYRVNTDRKGNQKFLSTDQIFEAVKDKFGEEHTKEEVEKALDNATKTVDLKSFLFGSKGVAGKASGVLSGIGSVLKAIAPELILSLGIAAVTATWKGLDNQFDLTKATTTKKYQKAQEKNETAQSDLETAQSAYATNQDRIQELRAKENRSLEESQELNTLQDQNELLGAQVSLKQKLADSAKTAEADAAQKDLKKKSLQQDYFSDGSGIYNPQAKVYVNDLDEAQAKMDYIQHLQDRYDTAYENIKKGHGGNMDLITEDENKTLERQQESIDTQKSELSEMISNISDQSQSMLKDDGTVLDKKYQGTIDQVNSLIDNYSNLIGSSSDTEDKLNNLFALADYADLQTKLEDIGKSKGSQGILDTLSDDKTYSKLKAALEDKNVSTDDLASYIMAIADPEALNIEGVKENLKDTFAFMSKLPSTSGGSIADAFFKDKSDKDIETFWNYLQNNGLNPEENDWGIGTLTSNWNKAMEESKSSSEDASKTFSSLFKNSAEDTATDIDTVTDNFQSSISSIKSAMDSLKSGDMKNSDITDLIQQFPELATETDDLQTGLQKLATDKASTAIGKIRDAVKDTTDPKELAAADKYVQSILDGINTAGFDMSNAQDDVIKRVRSNLKGSEFLKDNAENTLTNLFDKYSGDKVAQQAIVKLSMDPSMATASLDEWIAKIDELRPQIHLDANDQDLENLSKDLTRLQTDASDMQTLMSNKSALNQKATAQDYNNLVENGNAQISNLNKQIKDYQDNIRTIRESKGISPLTDEDNEKIKGYQDQIQSAQMSIENMKASQAGWLEEIQNLPITDVTNLASALSTAIGETNSETGLTSDSVKNLVTQFSDLTAQGTDISGLFTRSAKGLQLNTDRFQELSEAQNEMVSKDLASQIADQEKKIHDSNGNIIESEKQKLEELKNLQNEYMAQYKNMQEQTSQWQKGINAESTPNAGDHYKATKSKLESLKEMYDNGEIGTDDFKEKAAYFSPYGFTDADNFIENYNKWKPYYTDDKSGPLKFLDLLQSKGLATYKTLEDGSKQWQMTFADSDVAAKAVGMSEEQFKDYIGRYEDMGGVVTNISSIAEGEADVTKKTKDLISAQEKYSELVANGAPQYAIEQQAQVVDDLKNQVNDANTALDTYVNGTTDREVQNLNTAKQTINDFAKEYQQVKDDPAQQEYAQGLYDRIQQLAKDNKIKLTPEFEVDEDAFNQMLHDKGIGTFESPLTAEEMGISDPTAAKEYANSLEAVKQAHEANAEATEADFNALKQYTATDLEGIQLGDGAYNVEGMEQAEDALQDLANQAGLTKDQLVQALEGLGVLKPEVDSSEIEEAGEKAEETSADLQNLSGSKYTIEADLSTSGGTEDLTNSLASIPQGTTATVDVEVNGEDQVENLTSAMESVPDNTPVTITCDVQNQEELDAINAKADELNAQGKQITVEATIKKDSKDVDSYKPKDKEGKAIYHVNASEVNAWTPPVKGGTVNYTVNAGSVNAWTPPVKGGTVQYHATLTGATGTMTSIAHADGTAYNMLNLKPLSSAHAGGNVALNQNETALTNEVGTESIVRDGVWSLLPGGPHFENLKKGDIIFNASQTKDLLEHGRTNSNARAYAQGSLGSNAYALTGFNFKDTSTRKSTSSSSSNKKSSGSNSGSGSGSGKKNKSSSKSSSKKYLDDIVDWFERLVKKLENRIDLNAAKAENTYKLANKETYINKQLKDNQELQKDYAKGAKMYTKKSDKFAKDIGLSADLKNKVKNGKIDLAKLSDDNKKKVEAYQKWYDKINDCNKAIEELKQKEKELYQQKLNNITERYDALIGVYSSYNETLDSLNSAREEKGASQAPNSDYTNTIRNQISSNQTQADLIYQEIQKYQTAYNEFAKKYGPDDTATKEAKATLEGLNKSYYDIIQSTAEYENKLKEIQLTYDQWQVDKYQRASDKLSDSRDYKEKNNYKGSGNDLTENDYLNAIKTNDKTAIALNNRRNDIINQMSQYSENSTQYQDLAKDLADINSSIIDTANSTAELKKSIVDLRFKAFSDIQDDLNDYIDNLNDLQDMMDSDTFLNDDGSFTKQGLSNILLISKEMDAYKQQIVDYRQQLSEVQELYDNHMITLDEYEDATKDAVSNINKASKSLYSSQQNMLKAYEDQITKVNKSLQDNIDKRKDALSAKKDYYDYDKTLKDKNKDINTLKAQIAALEGTTNASAKARLAQLKADLKDKEDDLADTKYEHQIDLESKGYDNLSEQANDALDKTLQAVKSNTELQKSVINNMLKEVQNSYSDAYSNIQKTIEDTGYKTSDMFDDLIKKAQLTNKTISEIPTNVPKTNTDEIDSQRPDKSGSDNAVNNALNSQDPSGSNSTVETIEQRQTREQAEAAAAAAQKAKAAVESATNTKSKLQEWYNSVPTGKVTSSKFKEKHHDFYYYFWKKNKKVGQKDFEQVAKILGHNYIASKPYKDWKKSWKDKILKELKGYGFSKGGVVRQLIPADANSFLGDAILKNGDTGFAPINPGETILTQEFTKQLKPATATMSQFNDMLSGKSPNIPASNQENTFNSNVTINVDSISSDVDVKKLAKEVSNTVMNDYSKYMRKDMMKLTGRNR